MTMKVEELGRNLVVIDNRHRFFACNHFRRIDLFDGFVQLLALQERIHALDGADADLAVFGDIRRFEPLDVVEFGEFTVVVTGHVGHKFLLGLFAQMLGIYEKEDALGVSVSEQPVDRGDGGVGLARASGHLNEGAWTVIFEGYFELLDGVDLARSQSGGV